MAKHTPGPWKFFESTGGDYYRVMQADDPDISRIALVEVFAPTDTEGDMEEHGKANAHLIAAAPDLLAALKCAKTELEYLGYKATGILLHEINAAISKAENV